MKAEGMADLVRLDPSSPGNLTLIERLGEEMVRRWRVGERPRAEEYLARHPELWNHPEAALELLAEELSLRQEVGEEIEPAELDRRFPHWQQPVQILLRCHRLLASPRVEPPPAVGEMLGDFRLLAELGRGAHGSAFLAAQPSLAGRPVVLKLSPNRSAEHLCLARLQHTHIVPLYSIHEFPDRGLHGLCLPYLGGTTLSKLLDRLPPQNRRTGRDMLVALRKAQALLPVAIPVTGPACRFLDRASYIQAICWLGVCLADALHYAHERGLVHLDIKPSNVLLAADSQPLLLDFHLAREALAAGSAPPVVLGGTPGHMAPEHEAALVAIRERRVVPFAVDGRADVYSLGVILYEALAGSPPPSDPTATTLRQQNPQVPSGLANLLVKCLAADPKRRYRTADALAADLRRYLADLPLCGVADRSPAERWRRWRRRRPHDLPLLFLLLLTLTVGGMLGNYWTRQMNKARTAMQQGRDFLIAGRPAEALNRFHTGLALVEDLPFTASLIQECRAGATDAERAQVAAELHHSCERLRSWGDAASLSEEQQQSAEELCKQIWQNREQIARQLAPFEHEQVRADLIAVAVLLADLRRRRAEPDRAQEGEQQAHEVLHQAETLLGPSLALDVAKKLLSGRQHPIDRTP